MQTELQIKKRRKVQMEAIVTTLALRARWSTEAITELVFELYRWMFLSASQKVRSRNGQSERYDGLSGAFQKSGRGTTFGDDWRNEIAGAVLGILFDDNPTAARWRREQKIATTRTVTLTLPTASRDHSTAELLDKMVKLRGRLTKSPVNKEHPGANVVTGVKLSLFDGRWGIWAMCSYSPNSKDEWWSSPTIKQRDGETFYEFMDRALAVMEAMFQPPCPSRSAPINMSLPCFVGFTGTNRETGKEMVGGVAIDDVFEQVELPTPIVGEAFKFKGERSAIWQSPKLRRFQEVEVVEQPEDFWVLMPGSERPSRLLAAKCDDSVYLVVETSWKGNGFFGSGGSGGGSWAMIAEHSAKRARARFMLHQDMYRRGYLHIGWREHQMRKVDAILNPFPGGEAVGLHPRQIANAERFCREVRSVLWQHHGYITDPASASMHCVIGSTREKEEEGEVSIGGEEETSDDQVGT